MERAARPGPRVKGREKPAGYGVRQGLWRFRMGAPGSEWPTPAFALCATARQASPSCFALRRGRAPFGERGAARATGRGQSGRRLPQSKDAGAPVGGGPAKASFRLPLGGFLPIDTPCAPPIVIPLTHRRAAHGGPFGPLRGERGSELSLTEIRLKKRRVGGTGRCGG